MRISTIVLSGILGLAGSATASAQAARLGRLPALAPLPIARADCRALPISAALRRDGVVSGTMVKDTSIGRVVSLGLNAKGHPRILLVMISDDSGGTRHETETVTVLFDTLGRVTSGSRAAMTVGTPARLSEDRRTGLLPPDTSQAVALVRAVLACRRR